MSKLIRDSLNQISRIILNMIVSAATTYVTIKVTEYAKSESNKTFVVKGFAQDRVEGVYFGDPPYSR